MEEFVVEGMMRKICRRGVCRICTGKGVLRCQNSFCVNIFKNNLLVYIYDVIGKNISIMLYRDLVSENLASLCVSFNFCILNVINVKQKHRK